MRLALNIPRLLWGVTMLLPLMGCWLCSTTLRPLLGLSDGAQSCCKVCKGRVHLLGQRLAG